MGENWDVFGWNAEPVRCSAAAISVQGAALKAGSVQRLTGSPKAKSLAVRILSFSQTGGEGRLGVVWLGERLLDRRSAVMRLTGWVGRPGRGGRFVDSP